jgi:uncharacterized protein YjbJ (UPF0337 family)
MGLADKFKGLLRSRKADISKGVDAAAKLARDKAPSKYQPKVESAMSQVKKAVAKMSSDDSDGPAPGSRAQGEGTPGRS